MFFLPGQFNRELLFWCLLAALGVGCVLARAPWPRAAWTGERAEALLAPVCLVLLAAGLAVRLADRSMYVYVCGLHSPFISEIMEGREIVKAWLLTQHQGIYTSLQDYPLLITLYGPLYSLLAAISTAWFGPGVFAARLVSVAAGILLGLVVGAVVVRRSGSWWAGLASCAVALLTPTMAYAAHARPDVLVWLTLFTGIFFLLRAIRTPQHMGLSFWGTAFFFGLAAFSKQQTWVYILAALGFCLWRRDLRPLGLRLGAVVAAGCALCLAGAQWATDGEFIRQTIVFPGRMSGLPSYNSFSSAGERFWEFVRSNWGLTVVFAAALAFRRRSLDIMDVMFWAGLASMVMVMRWWGSSVNHFLGLAMFMIIEIGMFLAWLGRGGRLGWIALCLGILAPPIFGVSVPTGPDPCGIDQEREDVRRVEAGLEALGGPVIMDVEGAYVFLGRPLFARLMLYDAWETDFFDQTGLWSLPDSPLAHDIQGRRAAAFVDSRVFMSRDLADMVRAYYQVAFQYGRYTVFTPRPDAAILAFGGLGKPCGPGACLEMAGYTGLKDWGNYLQPLEERGELVLKAQTPKAIGNSRLVFHPRFTGPGQWMRLSFSGDGSAWTPLKDLAFEGNTPGTGFENPQEASVEVPGDRVFFRVELIGGAQFWVTPRQPVLAYLGTRNLTGGSQPN